MPYNSCVSLKDIYVFNVDLREMCGRTPFLF